MALEYKHECNNCGREPSQDECYCDKCRQEYASDAYDAGKADGYDKGSKEGYDEGYAAAEKDLAKDAPA